MLLPLQVNGLNLDSATAVAVITGTASAGLTESQVVAGGETVIITLTNDTWVAPGATFNAIRQDIIDGLDSAQSEATGWNAEVRDKEVVGAVVRTSDTVVTITLTAAPAYDVTADETITATVPASALTGALELTASPTFGVTAAVASTRKGRSGKKKRYVVEVDGQLFQVANIAEAQAILQSVRDLAAGSAERDVTTTVTPKPPRIKVRTLAGAAPTSVTIQRDVRRTQTAVNVAYKRAAEVLAQNREIAAVLQQKRRDEDEEDAIIALLL